jgi:hypothetical protein
MFCHKRLFCLIYTVYNFNLHQELWGYKFEEILYMRENRKTPWQLLVGEVIANVYC